MTRILFIFALTIALFCSCGTRKESRDVGSSYRETFTNPILPRGSSPCVIHTGGRYIYTQSNYVSVSLWASETIEGLKTAREHRVFNPKDTYYISGPRLYRTDGKWYIYYCSEGQNMSTRDIHVLENPSEDPLQGTFTHKATINTGHRKSIHPYVFSHNGRRFLLWSGYDNHPENGIDILRIYIAEMDSPWTICTKPSEILAPKYEWECQWISNNGLRSKVPTYVNEAPVAIHSRDSSKVLLYFAASQTNTPYYCEGMAIASVESDLLNPGSWKKYPEPVFRQNPKVNVYGAGHLSFFQTSKELYVIYQAYSSTERSSLDHRSPRMEPVIWNEDGIPELGEPSSLDVAFPEPEV